MRKIIINILLGGFTVVLPLALLSFLFKWLVDVVVQIIQPMTNLIMKGGFPQGASGLIAVAIILCVCFAVGLFQRTRLGEYSIDFVEEKILKKIPGYKITKEVVSQFIGGGNSPFKKVGVAELFGNETKVTIFVVDEHDFGYTVFMPTGPNPTSGNIYHVPRDKVRILENASVEDTMKSILACGAGSKFLFDFKKDK